MAVVPSWRWPGSLALGVRGRARHARVRLGHRRLDVRDTRVRDGRLEIRLADRVRVEEGVTLEVHVTP